MIRAIRNGFTLYELLTTLLVVGVVLTLGVPNLTEFTRNSRMTATANDLHSAMQLARSEAARAKSPVTICASANPMSPTASCGGTWEQGYIVFIDDDGNLQRAGDRETVIRAHGPAETGVMLRVANDARYFSYAATGMGRGHVGDQPSLSQVVMCDKRGNIRAAGGSSAARLLVITPLGRAKVVRDKAIIGAALNDMDQPCP
jgi:type IV fimbrial biogenesis protein FimT